MKKLLLAVALMTAMAVPASADVTMQFPDKIKDTFTSAQQILDQCIGSVVSHSDSTACQQMRTFLIQLANQPTTPVATPSPAPDADKK